MRVHDEMIFTLQKMFPGSHNGIDYFVGHPVSSDLKRSGDPFIAQWNLPVPQPTWDEMLKVWEQHKPEYIYTEHSITVRSLRKFYLEESDVMLARAMEDENTELTTSIKNYRRYLRDLTKDPNFPNVGIAEPPYKSSINRADILFFQLDYGKVPVELHSEGNPNAVLENKPD